MNIYYGIYFIIYICIYQFICIIWRMLEKLLLGFNYTSSIHSYITILLSILIMLLLKNKFKKNNER